MTAQIINLDEYRRRHDREGSRNSDEVTTPNTGPRLSLADIENIRRSAKELHALLLAELEKGTLVLELPNPNSL